MTPERWRQINELFHAASSCDAGGRDELLDRTAAAPIPELAAEVRSLLAVHKSARPSSSKQPAWAVAPTLAFDDDPADRRRAPMAGPYRIVREIGRGGMGVVYEAEDTRLRRTVALKALPAEYTRDPVRRERLTREARAAAALTHPVDRHHLRARRARWRAVSRLGAGARPDAARRAGARAARRRALAADPDRARRRTRRRPRRRHRPSRLQAREHRPLHRRPGEDSRLRPGARRPAERAAADADGHSRSAHPATCRRSS